MYSTIKTIFNNFTVGGQLIPVSLIRYNGHGEPYITYNQTQIDDTLYGDNDLINYKDYYDFDIYSKSNYLEIIESVKNLLTQNGWEWQPSMTSEDLYEADTGYYHKTLCFAIERSN